MKHHVFIPDFLKRAVKYYPDKTAVVDGDIRLTYRQLEGRVHQLSNMLVHWGVNKGDRVAYLGPNTLPLLEGIYGVMQIGAVNVPLNTRLNPEDYVYTVNHSEAKVFMVDADWAHLIDPVRDQLDQVQHLVLLPSPERKEKKDWIPYEDTLATFSTQPPAVPEMDEMDLCSILYTSGTDGRSKGVMHSHRSLYFNALNSIIHLPASDRDVVLHTLPLFHVHGWGAPFTFTSVGATHVMLRKIDPPHIFNLIEQEKVSIFFMAPTVLNMLMSEPKAKKMDHHVRVVIAGSAPPPSYVKQVEDYLGWEFVQVYGMTEAAPFLTVSHIKSHFDQDRSNIQNIKAKTGIGMINTEVRVVNENGVDVKPDGKQVGEVIARGNIIMEGYWKQPEETKKVLQNGWYFTGDLATMDEEGYIQIVDRKKDIIISGGENISSIEVEGVIYRHPAVQDASVIAIPHEKWGEVPHAFCVLKEGYHLTEEELIEFCRKHLPGFKSPKSCSIVEELPKTASGKIIKAHLRKSFWSDRESKVN